MTRRPISPRHCESCVPVVSYSDYTTEYRHENECPESKTK